MPYFSSHQLSKSWSSETLFSKNKCNLFRPVRNMKLKIWKHLFAISTIRMYFMIHMYCAHVVVHWYVVFVKCVTVPDAQCSFKQCYFGCERKQLLMDQKHFSVALVLIKKCQYSMNFFFLFAIDVHCHCTCTILPKVFTDLHSHMPCMKSSGFRFWLTLCSFLHGLESWEYEFLNIRAFFEVRRWCWTRRPRLQCMLEFIIHV